MDSRTDLNLCEVQFIYINGLSYPSFLRSKAAIHASATVVQIRGSVQKQTDFSRQCKFVLFFVYFFVCILSTCLVSTDSYVKD